MWKWSIPNWRLNSLLIWVCLLCGFLLASPYVIYQLFRFVSPALYENEKKYSTRVVGWGYFLFMMGVLLNYFWFFLLLSVFLLPIRSVWKWRTRLLCPRIWIRWWWWVWWWGLFSRSLSFVGFCQTGISYGWFYEAVSSSCYCYYSDSWSCYHSYVRCFTLMMVSVPMYLLYEVSIWIVSRTGKNSRKNPWKKCLKIMRW